MKEESRLLKTMIQKGDLPSIIDILGQLKKRVSRLEEELQKSWMPDEEIIFTDEIAKAKAIITDIENNHIKESISNDIIVQNTHAELELALSKSKKVINNKIEHGEILLEEDIVSYNTTTHKYNLFCNVLESLY